MRLRADASGPYNLWQRSYAMTWSDGKCRCRWANPGNPRYIRYHDEEWGVPVDDDRRLFEMLILEGFQAGLSWETSDCSSE